MKGLKHFNLALFAAVLLFSSCAAQDEEQRWTHGLASSICRAGTFELGLCSKAFGEKIMEFRPITSADYEAVRQFLAENGWQNRVADAERFRRMMENANRTVAAFEDERIVGFARALCDDVSNGYIGTVVVAEDFRRKGIGRELVERLIGNDKNITWVLRAGRGSSEFWKKLGFSVSEAAMEKRRSG